MVCLFGVKKSLWHRLHVGLIRLFEPICSWTWRFSTRVREHCDSTARCATRGGQGTDKGRSRVYGESFSIFVLCHTKLFNFQDRPFARRVSPVSRWALSRESFPSFGKKGPGYAKRFRSSFKICPFHREPVQFKMGRPFTGIVFHS